MMRGLQARLQRGEEACVVAGGAARGEVRPGACVYVYEVCVHEVGNVYVGSVGGACACVCACAALAGLMAHGLPVLVARVCREVLGAGSLLPARLPCCTGSSFRCTASPPPACDVPTAAPPGLRITNSSSGSPPPTAAAAPGTRSDPAQSSDLPCAHETAEAAAAFAGSAAPPASAAAALSEAHEVAQEAGQSHSALSTQAWPRCGMHCACCFPTRFRQSEPAAAQHVAAEGGARQLLKSAAHAAAIYYMALRAVDVEDALSWRGFGFVGGRGFGSGRRSHFRAETGRVIIYSV